MLVAPKGQWTPIDPNSLESTEYLLPQHRSTRCLDQTPAFFWVHAPQELKAKTQDLQQNVSLCFTRSLELESHDDLLRRQEPGVAAHDTPSSSWAGDRMGQRSLEKISCNIGKDMSNTVSAKPLGLRSKVGATRW